MLRIILVTIFTFVSVSANAQSLSRALNDKMNYLIARQNVITSNIANSSTPGYLARDIEFSPRKNSNAGGLRMNVTSKKHISLGKSSLSKYKQTTDKTFIRNDGNSVRIDQQMYNLAKVQQEYNLATKLYSKHIAMQKLAVQAK